MLCKLTKKEEKNDFPQIIVVVIHVWSNQLLHTPHIPAANKHLWQSDSGSEALRFLATALPAVWRTPEPDHSRLLGRICSPFHRAVQHKHTMTAEPRWLDTGQKLQLATEDTVRQATLRWFEVVEVAKKLFTTCDYMRIGPSFDVRYICLQSTLSRVKARNSFSPWPISELKGFMLIRSQSRWSFHVYQIWPHPGLQI